MSVELYRPDEKPLERQISCIDAAYGTVESTESPQHDEYLKEYHNLQTPQGKPGIVSLRCINNMRQESLTRAFS